MGNHDLSARKQNRSGLGRRIVTSGNQVPSRNRACAGYHAHGADSNYHATVTRDFLPRDLPDRCSKSPPAIRTASAPCPVECCRQRSRKPEVAALTASVPIRKARSARSGTISIPNTRQPAALSTCTVSCPRRPSPITATTSPKVLRRQYEHHAEQPHPKW